MEQVPDKDALFEKRQNLQLMGPPAPKDPRAKKEYWATIYAAEPQGDAENGHSFKSHSIGTIPIAEKDPQTPGKINFFPWDDIALKLHPDAAFYNAHKKDPSYKTINAMLAYRDESTLRFGPHGADSTNGFDVKTDERTNFVHSTYNEALGLIRHQALSKAGKPYRFDFMKIDYDLVNLFNSLAQLLTFNIPRDPTDLEREITKLVRVPIVREIIGEQSKSHWEEKSYNSYRLSTSDYQGLTKDSLPAGFKLARREQDESKTDDELITEIHSAVRKTLHSRLDQIAKLALEPDKKKDTHSHMGMVSQVVPALMKAHAITSHNTTHMAFFGYEPSKRTYTTQTGENLRIANQTITAILEYFGYKRNPFYEVQGEDEERKTARLRRRPLKEELVLGYLEAVKKADKVFAHLQL